MRKSILLLAITAIMCGCSQNKQTAENKQTSEHKLIAPLPAGVAIDNLQDCIIPAAFTPDDFNWMGGNLKLTAYNQDLYDVVDISQMKIGDTIIYEGNPMVINKITKDNGNIDINGGLEEGGCWLSPNEGGTYMTRIWDDHATYTELGKAEVALADDFVIIDCGMEPNDPIDTIRTGQKLYIENLNEFKKDFSPLNTRVTIEKGMVTEIHRNWIP